MRLNVKVCFHRLSPTSAPPRQVEYQPCTSAAILWENHLPKVRLASNVGHLSAMAANTGLCKTSARRETNDDGDGDVGEVLRSQTRLRIPEYPERGPCLLGRKAYAESEKRRGRDCCSKSVILSNVGECIWIESKQNAFSRSQHLLYFKMPRPNNDTIAMYGSGDTIKPHDRASFHTNKLFPTILL